MSDDAREVGGRAISSTPMPLTRDARIDALIEEHVVAAGAAPCGVAAWGRGVGGRWEIAIGAAGKHVEADGEGPPVGPDAIFDLASVTKPLTAIAVAELIAASMLAPSTEVGEVLPELADLPAASARIDALLSHRAGLPAWGQLDRKDPWSATTDRSLPGDDGDVPLETLLRRAASRRDRRGSADPSVYSDLGFVLLGAIVARVDRAPLAARWERRCGASSAARRRARGERFDARVVANEVVAWRGGAVRGVVHDENAYAIERAGGDPGHAGAFATVDELTSLAIGFLDALDGSDPLLPASIASWMIEPLASPGTHRRGWDSPTPGGSQSGTRFGPRAFGHLGFTGTSVWIDPDARAIAVLLTNRSHPTRDNQRIRAARPKLNDALWDLR